MQLFPNSTKHDPPNHTTLLPAEKLLFLVGTRNCDYQVWQRLDTPQTRDFQKRFGCAFSPPSLTTRISNFAEVICIFSTQSFFISKRCTCQNTREPRHVRGNSSLQLALEKSQATISYLLMGKKLLPVKWTASEGPRFGPERTVKPWEQRSDSAS